MKPEYEAWIQEWRSRNVSLGMCSAATSQMQKAFPELRRVRGHVIYLYGRAAHWWLETSEHGVVDPTADQFHIIHEYEEYKEGQEVRIGRCMNCGMDIYDITMHSKKSTSLCSEECENLFRIWLDESPRP